jgi:hypothetical protein
MNEFNLHSFEDHGPRRCWLSCSRDQQALVATPDESELSQPPGVINREEAQDDESPMPKQAHSDAATHHENAARAHRSAAESHGKNDPAAAKKSEEAHGHSMKAHEASTGAHSKSNK